jgi:DNA-binding PadR family transcriptional regulator
LSPVFRHGSLRLYLLRLLAEEPRHGYEVIRLLRDRFMGVYSPSPGTIYPRLARLEEEGLVTHDEVDGRKVYRITEAGREELRSRSDELDELEEELSASVSDIVREVREDVRQTVRSLREELTWAARESRRMSRDLDADLRERARQAGQEAKDQARQAREQAREQARQEREQAKEHARQAKEQGRQEREQAKEQGRQEREDAKRVRDGARKEAERARQQEPQVRGDAWQQATDEDQEEGPAKRAPADQPDSTGQTGSTGRSRAEALGQDAARRVREHARRLREEAQRAREETAGPPPGSGGFRDRIREEAGARFQAREQDWEKPWSRAGWPGWTEWPGRRGWEEWIRLRGVRDRTGPLDFGTIRDLERVAVQFTSDLRKLALQSTAVGENVINDLRAILEEALERIKTEIFGSPQEAPGPREAEEAAGQRDTSGQQAPAGQQDAADADSDSPGRPPRSSGTGDDRA